MSDKDCPERWAIAEEELNYTPAMKEEYDDLPGFFVERMTQKEWEYYLVNKEEYDRWHKEHRIKLGNHLKKCKTSGCQITKQAWLEDYILKEFVQ